VSVHLTIVGTGYVGLVTGACLADLGMDVTCVDNDEDKIGMLQSGRVPIYEPGLDALVSKNAKEGRLRFTTKLKEAVEKSLAIFIAVGTPPREDGSADLSYVVKVAEAIAEFMDGYKVVVTKSTVPIATGQLIERTISSRNPRHAFSVVSNPEFLREGSAVADFMHPDRIIIGARDPQAIAIMKDIYAPLTVGGTPLVITGVESSELVKYASNAFLAMKITFINEVADLCERLGADVNHVAKGMGLDPRIGQTFLFPGPGYGGSCFPKDTKALAEIARSAGRPFEIVETVVRVNEEVKLRMVDKVRAACGGSVDGVTIGVLGLSFKPETDDMREAASIPILERLVAEGAAVQAYDPVAMSNARDVLPASVRYCEDAYAAAAGADCLVILTEWNQFRSLDLDRLRAGLRRAHLIDLRNVYEPDRVRAAGFVYDCIGRAPVE
jgi:UDPglucose 6-dehydrogenase